MAIYRRTDERVDRKYIIRMWEYSFNFYNTKLLNRWVFLIDSIEITVAEFRAYNLLEMVCI